MTPNTNALGYRITRDDRSVQAAIQRIACEETGAAITEIDDPDLDIAQTVHQVRKRCKRIRSLIRLVQPSFPAYDHENRTFRDAAATLSRLRDTHVFIETYDALIANTDGHSARHDFSSIRRFLAARYTEGENRKHARKRLQTFRETMATAAERAARWRIDEDGFDAVAGGLGTTYARARKEMKRAAETPGDDEALHGWRKRVKYHGDHTRLLAEIWPKALKPHGNAAGTLSNMIGRHHDLAVLRAELADKARKIENSSQVPAFVELIQAHQSELEKNAFALGRRLFAEKAQALMRRWGTYWTAWRTK